MHFSAFLTKSTRVVTVLALTMATGLLAQETRPPNILLLIGDDIGVEALKSYHVGSKPAHTPNLDALAANGLVFTHVWSQPSCSPTRATLLTGRYGFRTGVGLPTGGPGTGLVSRPPRKTSNAAIEYPENISLITGKLMPSSIKVLRQQEGNIRTTRNRPGLRPDELGIASVLKETNPAYATAAIGKWHLADGVNGRLEHPRNIGFDHFSVISGNAVPSYFAWNENVNGTVEGRRGYTPDAKLWSAIHWLKQQENNPWFLWYAFNLPHSPYFIPRSMEGKMKDQPSARSTAQLEDSNSYFDLLVEEMDRVIGRLLTSLSDETRRNTMVIFVGDNGSAMEAIDSPFDADRSKFTLYQGGIHVPLIISGPSVARGKTVSALVNTTDIFSTIIELAGASKSDVPADSISLVPYFANPSHKPLRDWIYADVLSAELGISKGDFAIRNNRYKLISSLARQELYDLSKDPYETKNLLVKGLSDEDQTALDELLSAARKLHGSENQISPEPKRDL